MPKPEYLSDKQLLSIKNRNISWNEADSVLFTLECDRRMLKRYKKELEGLTPSGSEFVDDPERCAAFVKDRLSFNMGLIKENRKLKAQVELLEEAIKL